MFTPLKNLPEGKNWTLDELNDRQVQLLIPVIAFISIAMAVGTVGNLLVLYVNIFVFKFGKSTYRYFIILLAVTDISFCMIGDTFILSVLHLPYKFTYTLACKSLRAFCYFNALVSAMILSVIALDRYRRICRPYGNQFSVRRIKIIVLIIIVVSFIFSIPCFILYGRNTVQTGIANITGVQCFPDDIHKDTIFPIAYGIFLYTVFIVLTITISIFYTLLWRHIRKHIHNLQTNALSYRTKPNVYTTTTMVTSTEIKQTLPSILDDSNDQSPPKIQDEPNEPANHGSYIEKQNEGNKDKDNTEKVIRVSKMLFLVTSIFMLSYAPFLSLELLTFFDGQLIDNLDNTVTVVYQLFWRTFSINFMVNPFIYGVMDRRFRMECKKLISQRLRV
ncbi:hypothetical protein CHS0354_014250 [Potamilus streckersoni]|uniref:G-protein coupled receptors family 1 profile domain-containing protein n=1 Tax=Potamilus streckersoni TaxID=2493646 RepID=A0AAE0T1I3_9BIVA|nr:hypothetical protein CHS0354_014250 [Potamilus streckersoni]